MILQLIDLAVAIKSVALSTVIFIFMLFLILELILRKSEQLNLINVPQLTRKLSTEETHSSTSLENSLKTLSDKYGHVNSLHTNEVSFSSEYLNFVSGWRLTTDEPGGETSNLYVFGGSTMQCVEVSDSQTICSSLQRQLNANLKMVRVNNRGVSGMTVEANYEVLLKTQILKGDRVIVYFGVNDSKLDTYWQKAIFPFKFIPGYIKILGGLRLTLNLRVAEWLWLETVKPADRTIENAKSNAVKVTQTLSSMNIFVTSKGGTFMALLQPNIFTKNGYTKRDTEIYSSSKINPRIIKLQYAEYTSALKNQTWFVSITDAIDDHKTTPYLDWNHLDQTGNDLVAKSILKQLQILSE